MANSQNIKDFRDLDLGTGQPIATAMETINVEITADDMVADYADAFVTEAERVNPLLAQQVQLSREEMRAYAKFLLAQRVDYVAGGCREWRRLKALYIPVFLQYAMRMIGRVVIRAQGITLNPVMPDDDTITLDEALVISDKVGAFESCLQVVQDAMPRDTSGDESVMGTALIAGYVRAIRRVDHVADTYVSAFLGMKLQQEQAFAVLYRVQYDDIEFIRTALTARHELFR